MRGMNIEQFDMSFARTGRHQRVGCALGGDTHDERTNDGWIARIFNPHRHIVLVRRLHGRGVQHCGTKVCHFIRFGSRAPIRDSHSPELLNPSHYSCLFDGSIDLLRKRCRWRLWRPRVVKLLSNEVDAFRRCQCE